MVDKINIFDMSKPEVVNEVKDKIVDTADKIQDHFNLFDETWVNILMANDDYDQLIDLYALCKKVYMLMNAYENGKIGEIIKL